VDTGHRRDFQLRYQLYAITAQHVASNAAKTARRT